MYPDAASTLLTFDTARIVSSSQQPSSEPTNWAGDMDRVARLRDRDCFMRIYDHFMPRLCVYLRGLGAPDAVAEELAQECLLRLWLRASDYDAAQGALSAGGGGGRGNPGYGRTQQRRTVRRPGAAAPAHQRTACGAGAIGADVL
ncbi:hypothetical protein G6F22_018342 [Rhizopus arrhizus]|nr:hypothetical protein G6F22_018342 [Rhizopus arrhizus]